MSATQQDVSEATLSPAPLLMRSTAVPQGEARLVVPAPYKRHVTIVGETIEKLHLAKEMLRHALPTGEEDAIVDRP